MPTSPSQHLELSKWQAAPKALQMQHLPIALGGSGFVVLYLKVSCESWNEIYDYFLGNHLDGLLWLHRSSLAVIIDLRALPSASHFSTAIFGRDLPLILDQGINALLLPERRHIPLESLPSCVQIHRDLNPSAEIVFDSFAHHGKPSPQQLPPPEEKLELLEAKDLDLGYWKGSLRGKSLLWFRVAGTYPPGSAGESVAALIHTRQNAVCDALRPDILINDLRSLSYTWGDDISLHPFAMDHGGNYFLLDRSQWPALKIEVDVDDAFFEEREMLERIEG